MKKRKSLVRIFSIILVLAISASVMVQAKDPATEYSTKLDLLVKIIKERHIDVDPDDDPIRRGVLKMCEDDPEFFETFANAMFQSYDPYSYYMNPEKYAVSFPQVNTFAGIGITIIQKDDGCYIQTVVPSGPAQTAGLVPGDKLLKIDGKDVTQYSPSMISDLVRGPEGETLEMTVFHYGEEYTCTVKRATIPLSNVSFSDLGDKVAYIRITKLMGISTYMDFCTYYETLEERGFKSVILDLRDCPGGDIDCLINMMDVLIPDKDMPYLMIRQSNPMSLTTFVSEGYGWDFNKMVILVNENTASSAEVLSGAMQDLGYAELVGVTTKGKGLGQTHLQLPDESIAVVSSLALHLPLSGNYTGVGIRPKHYVELGYKDRDKVKVEEFDVARGVYASLSKNVLAAEQRLYQMGYLEVSPDATADFRTWHAINQFQKDNGLEQTPNGCDAVTVRILDRVYNEFLKTPIVTDTQLQRAKAIAREGARSNTKPTPIAPEQADFSREN